MMRPVTRRTCGLHHSRTRGVQTNLLVPRIISRRRAVGIAICYHTAAVERSGRKNLARISYEAAYPAIELSRRSRNWWAWLKGTPAECIHLDGDQRWMATLLPDTLYLRGKRAIRRDPLRPEVSLCRDCLMNVAAGELQSYPGRVVAFEPDAETFTQYFFVAAPDFEAAGLRPEVAVALAKRLAQNAPACTECARAANWLWFSREAVGSLDEVDKIAEGAGDWYCPAHGSRRLCATFENIADANVFYMNLPYGEAGAYVWI
jgi:hypothetical protein